MPVLLASMKATQDYRRFFRDACEDRCQRNSRYSLRAFARDLGISAPRLSKILNGRHGLSVEAASEIARRLGLSESEQDLFMALVESEHGRAAVTRSLAKKRAGELSDVYQDLGL